jgi:hypothetical protein
MSLPIYVDAYSGYRANERPRQFCLDDDVFEIVDVEDRWYDPNAEYFKVRTNDQKCFLLRCDAQSGEWTLQSGFDGAELLARTSTLVTVEPQAIRSAERRVAGCEARRSEQAELPFDWILADVLCKHGPYDFIRTEPGQCPNCKAELSKKSLVEPQGGIKVGVPAVAPGRDL